MFMCSVCLRNGKKFSFRLDENSGSTFCLFSWKIEAKLKLASLGGRIFHFLCSFDKY